MFIRLHKMTVMPTRILLLLLITAFNYTFIQAQGQPPQIRGMLPEKGIYRFPAFIEGSIVFRNGIISSARLNYNVSLDEMHFINQDGDTLSVAEPVTISFISTGNSRFYYDKGYLQTIDTSGAIILAFKQSLASQQMRTGAYGMTTPHEGIRNYTFFTGNGQRYKLGEDEEIKVTSRENYFFGDAYGHFKKAGKEFIYDHYEKHQADLKEFIKTNHINFNDLKDLERLMQFCKKIDS